MNPPKDTPEMRSDFMRNLLRVYREVPQLPISRENIFGLTPYDFNEFYIKHDGPFVSARSDATPDFHKYTERYFMANQEWIMDALHTTAARQFFVESLVQVGILQRRFFVPVDTRDANSDWIVCDLQPAPADSPSKRRTVWYSDDLENPRQKISFMLLTAEDYLFHGIKGFGNGANFRVTHHHILSLSRRAYLFADLAIDIEDLDHPLGVPSNRFHVQPLYYQTLFRTIDRNNRALLSKYSYISPWFLYAFMLSDSNYHFDNAEMANFVSYFSSIHKYVKGEYEKRVVENALDAEIFLANAALAITHHAQNKGMHISGEFMPPYLLDAIEEHYKDTGEFPPNYVPREEIKQRGEGTEYISSSFLF